MKTIELKNKDIFLKNFSCCYSWEEKYLYIIELGNTLSPIPSYMRNVNYLISGCQSNAWIILSKDNIGRIKFYGDSDALIVKGLIAILFILYEKMTLLEIVKYDAKSFFNSISLTKHLTKSRSNGLEAMMQSIRFQATSKL